MKFPSLGGQNHLFPCIHNAGCDLGTQNAMVAENKGLCLAQSHPPCYIRTLRSQMPSSATRLLEESGWICKHGTAEGRPVGTSPGFVRQFPTGVLTRFLEICLLKLQCAFQTSPAVGSSGLRLLHLSKLSSQKGFLFWCKNIASKETGRYSKAWV